jgi:hypothetical protein
MRCCRWPTANHASQRLAVSDMNRLRDEKSTDFLVEPKPVEPWVAGSEEVRGAITRGTKSRARLPIVPSVASLVLDSGTPGRKQNWPAPETCRASMRGQTEHAIGFRFSVFEHEHEHEHEQTRGAAICQVPPRSNSPLRPRGGEGSGMRGPKKRQTNCRLFTLCLCAAQRRSRSISQLPAKSSTSHPPKSFTHRAGASGTSDQVFEYEYEKSRGVGERPGSGCPPPHFVVKRQIHAMPDYGLSSKARS